MKPQIASEAFWLAALRSERYRIVGMLLVLAAVAMVGGFRGIGYPQRDEWLRQIWLWSFMGTGALYEGGMLLAVRHAEKKQRPIAAWVWVINTILECSVPTVAIALSSLDKDYLGPYRALSAPVVLLYCFFIILATLRLSPGLCVLSGVVSAAGYIADYALTMRIFPHSGARELMPAQIYVVYPLFLFCLGLTAAAVSWQIRRHVMAALAEAATRAKLDQVEHDLQIARQIQMGLLPRKPPTIAGYDIAGWSQPADQTGGDYYDWMELPGGRVLFTVADASGHGIGPALLVTACRAYFRAIAAHGDPLEQITQQVDRLIAADVPDGRFITAVVALLEPEAHRLSMYSAGHAPLYWYTAGDDRVEEFDSDQPPLGLCYRDGDTRARVLAFKPGDTLVLVTDGLFEYANAAGELVGTERLGAAIRRHRVESSEMMIRKIYAEVTAFGRGVTQGDDMTAVVIKRHPADTGST